jgi:hypothetical protein
MGKKIERESKNNTLDKVKERKKGEKMKDYQRNVQTNEDDKVKNKGMKKARKKTNFSTIKLPVIDRGSPSKQTPCHVMSHWLASAEAFVF